MVVRVRGLSVLRKSLGLLAVSVLAATVMPTASLADGEDAPSGDFTVNVYADLEAFGDPCDVGPGESIIQITYGPSNYSSPDLTSATLDYDESEDWILTRSSGIASEDLVLEDLLDFFGVNHETLNNSSPAYDDSVLQSVTYNYETPVGNLPFDTSREIGVLDSADLVANSMLLQLSRQTIISPPYNVSYDADTCSDATGVLTTTRSEVMFEPIGETPMSIEIDWANMQQAPIFSMAFLKTTTDTTGTDYQIPIFAANSPPQENEPWGGYYPRLIGDTGEQTYEAFIHIFGNTPQGRVSVEFEHRLYVNAIQYQD